MPEIPECLHRRYEALDGLIQELNAATSQGSHEECCGDKNSSEPGLKLMCDFWNILKEDPHCDLTGAVKERMNVSQSSSCTKEQCVTCYVAGRGEKRRETANKIKKMCSQSGSRPPSNKESLAKCCKPHSSPASSSKEVLPLSKVLCNLQEAASFDKRCNARVNDLLNTQNDLISQIGELENREKEGVKMLKQADCMWACMEDAYKKKVAESLERQKTLLKQLKEAEASNAKWRKNKKDIERQMDNIIKCHNEIKEKMLQKSNDLKYMEGEIADFQKRIESNKKTLDGESQVIANKKQASDKRIKAIAEKVSQLKKNLGAENDNKYRKEQEGQQYLKEAREDLQNMCRVLLEKRLENEDLLAEKEALENEISLLNQTCDQCQDKCKNKEKYLDDEIKKINKEIAEYKVKCIQCHQCTDTIDARKLCSDCPRCAEERDCVTEGDHCNKDPTLDCVCMSVKEKFLDNIFENMYTVLERQSKLPEGKAVADSVMDCLRNSRNGKLNNETRSLLQDFVLNAVKKNLNLTIIGGAVKTRCEMDSETYNQLMLCLKTVKQVKLPKEDKGTVVKKEPCDRWGGTSECHCPSGGSGKPCICMQRAPPPPNDPNPCPPVYEKEEDKGQVIACPHKESTTCGQDCAMHAVPSLVGAEVASWRPDPCSGATCQFSKNMRAAQCVLGPESLSSLPKTYVSPAPNVSKIPNQMTCKHAHGNFPPKACTCGKDTSHHVSYSENTTERDNNICDNFWDHNTNEVYNGYNLQEKNADHNILNNIKQMIHNANIDNLSKPLGTSSSDKNQQNSGFDPKRIVSLKEAKNKEVLDDTEDLSTGFTTTVQVITDKSSGNLLIGLNEEVIDLMDKKSVKDHNMIATIKKTNSGHFVMSFDSIDDPEGYICRILEQRTPSGSRLLEVKKDFIKLLASKNSNTKVNEENNKIQSANILKLIKSATKTENLPDVHQVSIKGGENNIQPKQILNLSKISLEIEQQYIQNRLITLKLLNETGIYREINRPLSKTSSGNIAVNINTSFLLCNKTNDIDKEHAVLVTKSDSGEFILNTYQEDSFSNAVVKRINSDTCLLVFKYPVDKSDENVNIDKKLLEKYYKIHIKTPAYDIPETPAVLKLTSSNNYLVVPDKEFEISYKQTIQDLLEDNTEYYAKMMSTDSDNFVLGFKDSWDEPNALIVKDISGDIHVLKLQDRGSISDTEERKLSMEITLKVLDELLNKFPKKSKVSNRILTSESINMVRKSTNHSNLYDIVKLFLPDHEKNLNKSTPILKRTSSGQYSLILDNNSKKIFIKNLTEYLQNNSQDSTPLNKSVTEEMTLLLNSDHKDKSHFGVLKITPSGNIYITVNEKLVKAITKQSLNVYTMTPSFSDQNSMYFLSKIQQPMNKSVATTCHSKPSDCDLSKCVCSEINLQNVDLTISPSQTCKQMFFSHPGLKIKSCCDDSSASDSIKWAEQRVDASTVCLNLSEDKHLPHIVIKPCECKTVHPINLNTNKKCFYIYDVVRPLKENVSCVSADCNVQEKDEDESGWDSMNFLPPQLPDFLKGLKY